MAHTSVVPRDSSNVSGETFIAATNEKTFNKSPRRSASVDKKPNLAISGVEAFRKSLAKKGLSDTASKLISNSREMDQSQITIRPGENGLAGVLGENMIHFDVM